MIRKILRKFGFVHLSELPTIIGECIDPHVSKMHRALMVTKTGVQNGAKPATLITVLDEGIKAAEALQE